MLFKSERTRENIHVKYDNEMKNKIMNLAYFNYSQSIQHLNNDDIWQIIIHTLDNINNDFLSSNEMPELIAHYNYYDYSEIDRDDFVVVFDNKQLGNGYKSEEWVDEEIITAEFYEMAVGIDWYKKHNLNALDINQTVLWINLYQSSESSRDNIPRHIVQPNNNENKINFISIDPPKISEPWNKRKIYAKEELIHLILKCLTGFEAVNLIKKGFTIHTGNWGAGIFNNDLATVLLIQYITAWIAGCKSFHYWGLKYNIHDRNFISMLNNIQQQVNPLTLWKNLNSDFPLLKWFWLDNHNQWITYHNGIQNVLNSQLLSSNNHTYVYIDKIKYKIYKKNGTWIQENQLDENIWCLVKYKTILDY